MLAGTSTGGTPCLDMADAAAAEEWVLVQSPRGQGGRAVRG